MHYPGTYAAGVFNRLAEEKAGRRIENESIVNLPDWQSLTFRAEDGDWVDLATSTVDHYVQELDLRRGVLTRRFRVQDAAGRRTAVAQRRAVSMADPYLACLDATFVAENWSGVLIVRIGHRRPGHQQRGAPLPGPRRHATSWWPPASRSTTTSSR